MHRRDMLTRLPGLGALSGATAGLAAWLARQSHRPEERSARVVRLNHTVAADPNRPEMAIVQNLDPGQATRRAIEALGGIHRFIARGDVVVIKANKLQTPIRW